MAQDHNHNCFHAIEQSAIRLKESTDPRVGHFLYVGNQEHEDAHYLGNTAFAAQVFGKLVRDVARGHKFGDCPRCDAVANALLQAERTFLASIQASRTIAC